MKTFLLNYLKFFNHPFVTIFFIIFGAISVITATTLTYAILNAVLTVLFGVILYFELYIKPTYF